MHHKAKKNYNITAFNLKMNYFDLEPLVVKSQKGKKKMKLQFGQHHKMTYGFE